MALWKYQNKKKFTPKSLRFVYLKKNIQKQMTISHWNFEKNEYTGALFQCNVVMEDGEDVDKIWSVWDFELKEALKKKLKNKKGKASITITKKGEPFEEYYELE